MAVYTGRHFSFAEPSNAKLIEFATNHYLLSAAFVAALALLAFSESRRGGRSISNRELTALVNGSQAIIVDLRAHKDFASGHIVQALSIPRQARRAYGRA